MTIVTTSTVSGGKETVHSVDKVEGKTITPVSRSSSSSSSSGGSSSSSSSKKPTYTVTDAKTGETVGTYEYGGLKSRGEQMQNQYLDARAKEIQGQQQQAQANSLSPATAIAPTINPITGQAQLFSSTSTASQKMGSAMAFSQKENPLAVKTSGQDNLASMLMSGVISGASKGQSSTTVGRVTSSNNGSTITSAPAPQTIQQFQNARVAENATNALNTIINLGQKSGLSKEESFNLAEKYAQRNDITNVNRGTAYINVDNKVVSNLGERANPLGLSTGKTGIDFTAKVSALSSPYSSITPKMDTVVVPTFQKEATLTVDKPASLIREEVAAFDRQQAEMQSVNRNLAQFQNAKTRQAELNAKVSAYEKQSILDRDPNQFKQFQEEQKAIDQQLSMNPYVTKTADGNALFNASVASVAIPTSEFGRSETKQSLGEVTPYSVGYKEATSADVTTAELGSVLGKDGFVPGVVVGGILGSIESAGRQFVPGFDTTTAGRGLVGKAVQRVTGIEDAETARLVGEIGTKSVGYLAGGEVVGAIGGTIGSAAGAARLAGTASKLSEIPGAATVGKIGSVAGRGVEMISTPAQIVYTGLGAVKSGEAAAQGYQEGGAGRGLAQGLSTAVSFVGPEYMLTRGATQLANAYGSKLAGAGDRLAEGKDLKTTVTDISGKQTTFPSTGTSIVQAEGKASYEPTMNIFNQRADTKLGFTGTYKPATPEAIVGTQPYIPTLKPTTYTGRGTLSVDAQNLPTQQFSVSSASRVAPGEKYIKEVSTITAPQGGQDVITSILKRDKGTSDFTGYGEVKQLSVGGPQTKELFGLSSRTTVPARVQEGGTVVEKSTFDTTIGSISAKNRAAIDSFVGRTGLSKATNSVNTIGAKPTTFTKSIDFSGPSPKVLADVAAPTQQFEKVIVTPLEQTQATTRAVSAESKAASESTPTLPKSEPAPQLPSQIDSLTMGGSRASAGEETITATATRSVPQETSVFEFGKSSPIETSPVSPAAREPLYQSQAIDNLASARSRNLAQSNIAGAANAQSVKVPIGQSFSRAYTDAAVKESSLLKNVAGLLKVPLLTANSQALTGGSTRDLNMSSIGSAGVSKILSTGATSFQDSVNTRNTALDMTSTSTSSGTGTGVIDTTGTGTRTNTNTDTFTLPMASFGLTAMAPIMGPVGAFGAGSFGRGFTGYQGERTDVKSSIKMNKIQELEFGKNIQKFL